MKNFLITIVLAGLWACQSAAPVLAMNEMRETSAADYRSYLNRKFPATFEKLEVARDAISASIKLDAPSDYRVEDLRLAVLPAHFESHRTLSESELVDASCEIVNGRCNFQLPRVGMFGKDLSHCRFVLVNMADDGTLLRLSASVYPFSWHAGVQRELKKLVGRDQKGLGGIPHDSADPHHQIYDLGLSHSTINIVLNGIVNFAPGPGLAAWEFEGRTLYVAQRRLASYDARLAELRKRKIVASMILLIGNTRHPASGEPTHLVHPEAEPTGTFVMPNLATEEGAFLYRATIHHLAERFAREGETSGRVSNWIMHNEIDQSGTWTNMGPQTIERYMEVFTRSSRLVHHVTRQFNPHSRVFVSLTHYWNKISNHPHAFRARDMVDLFAQAGQVEGDFEWGIAYHPYPSDLRNPRTWNDVNVSLDFDTPLITSKNIEVLPAYLAQSRLLYAGKPRAILLSEQGCNSPTLSPEDQQLQAAGVVYMFNRIRLLPTVEAFHYHAYRDHPIAEGGLRLGLVDEKEQHKLAWRVYQSLNTGSEPMETESVWPIMGVEAKSWAIQKQAVKDQPN